MLTYKFFTALSKKPEYNYNLKKSFQIIIQCKHNASERKRQAKKLELFYHMHQIVLMHIDIYRSMCSRDFDHKDELEAFQKDDLISEFYIIFDRCVMNYKLEKLDKKGKKINFYFYYKKSLMWGIQRLYHLHQKKLQNIETIGWNSDWKYDIRTTEDNLDFEDFLMDQWGMTEIQKNIINAKMEGIPINNYIAQAQLTSSDYYKQLECIKNNITKQIYEGNFIHDQFVNAKWFSSLGIGGEQRRSVILAGQTVRDSYEERD